MRKGITGVYLITNKINGKQYVGASNNVPDRISQHFGSVVQRKYPHRTMYKDIKKYGRDEFDVQILEEVSEDEKLSREQHWYDVIQPEYNFVRPVENILGHPKVRERAVNSPKNCDAIKKRKKLYNTPEYQEFFKSMHPACKPVDMFKDGELVKSFIPIRGTVRWLDENTNYKSKNKASKVKAVCDGERKTAFGYTFKYSTESVETI